MIAIISSGCPFQVMQIIKFRKLNVLVIHLMPRRICGKDIVRIFLYVQIVVSVQEPTEHYSLRSVVAIFIHANEQMPMVQQLVHPIRSK